MRHLLPDSPPPWAALGRGLVAAGSALLLTGAVSGAAALAGEARAPSPSPVSPSPDAVAAGHLDWRYDASPGEHAADSPQGEPTVAVSDGAVQSPDGTLRFRVTSGTYDAASGAASLSYRGTAQFAYADHSVTVRDPEVTITGTTAATLRAGVSVTSAAAGGTPSSSPAPVELLDLRTFGIPPQVAGRQVTWNDVAAEPTPEGSRALEDSADDEVTIVLSLAQAPAPEGARSGGLGGLGAAAAAASTTPATTSPDPSAGTTTTGCPAATGTTTPTPTGSGTQSAGGTSPSATPTTTSASPSATTTDCPTTGPSGGSSDASGGGSGTGGSLPETGSAFLIPLTLAGGAMVTAGGGAVLAARRRPGNGE